MKFNSKNMNLNYQLSLLGRLFSVIILIMLSCQTEAQPTEFYNSGKIIPSNLPLSDGVKHGNLFFLSGQIGLIPGSGKLVSGGMKVESKQALDNIRIILESRSSGMHDIIQCNVYLTDMNEWASFNEIYQSYFKSRYPARTVVGVSQLPLQARVELQCISATSN